MAIFAQNTTANTSTDLDQLEQSMIAAINHTLIKNQLNKDLSTYRIKQGNADYGLGHKGRPCVLMQANPKDPNVCPGNPNQVQINELRSNPLKQNFISNYITNATKEAKNYSVDSVEAGNIGGTADSWSGIECLYKAQDELKNITLGDRIKDIEDQISKLQDLQKEFNESTRTQTLDLVNDKYNELFVGGGKNYQAFFQRSSCRAFHDPEQFQNFAVSGGIENILASTEEIRVNSNNFVRDSRSIKSKLESAINNISTKAGNDGVFNFLDNDYTDSNDSLGMTQTNSYKNAISELKDKYKNYFSNIDRKLKSVLDTQGADKEIYESITGANSSNGGDFDLDERLRSWKVQKDRTCMLDLLGGQEKVESLLNSPRNFNDSVVTNDYQADSTRRFKKVLQNILFERTNLSQNQIMSYIRKAIRENPNFSKSTLVLSETFSEDTSNSNTRWQIPDLIRKVQTNCNNRFKSRDFGPNSTTSYSKAYSVLKKATQMVKNTQNNFRQRLREELKAKLYTCTDTNTGSADPKANCTKDSMTVTGDFCFNQAVNCTKNATDCIGRIKNKFDTDRKNLKTLITNYNTKARALEQAQSKTYAYAKEVYEKTADFYKNKYGINFSPPKDLDTKAIQEDSKVEGLNVSNEKLSEKLDVKMLDPMKSTEKLISNLEKIKQEITNQNQKINEKIDTYIKRVVNNYKNAKSILEKNIEACNTFLNSTFPPPTGQEDEKIANCMTLYTKQVIPIDEKDQVASIIRDLINKGIIKDESKVSHHNVVYNANDIIAEVENLDDPREKTSEKDDEGNIIGSKTTINKDFQNALESSCNKLKGEYGNEFKTLTCEGKNKDQYLYDVKKIIQKSFYKISDELTDKDNKEGSQKCSKQFSNTGGKDQSLFDQNLKATDYFQGTNSQ